MLVLSGSSLNTSFAAKSRWFPSKTKASRVVASAAVIFWPSLSPGSVTCRRAVGIQPTCRILSTILIVDSSGACVPTVLGKSDVGQRYHPLAHLQAVQHGRYTLYRRRRRNRTTTATTITTRRPKARTYFILRSCLPTAAQHDCNVLF